MAPESAAVRLVVLNHNGADLLVRCLEALAKLAWPGDRLEVVVVDNASADGSDRVVEERFPAVRLIRNRTNTGFPANNIALRDLEHVDFVGLVNPDSCVEPGWLQQLVAALEADEMLGAVSPRMLFADRFADVEIHSPTFVPGSGDQRALGVRVSGARVDGVDRWRDVQFADGTWGIEHDRQGGTFQWTSDRSVVRLPTRPPGSADAAGRDDVAPGAPVAELFIAAERPKRVALRSGSAERRLDVGTEPA
ncbi:MAG: glycosyltransferase, partial [Acidimicrobiales bacterium]